MKTVYIFLILLISSFSFVKSEDSAFIENLFSDGEMWHVWVITNQDTLSILPEDSILIIILNLYPDIDPTPLGFKEKDGIWYSHFFAVPETEINTTDKKEAFIFIEEKNTIKELYKNFETIFKRRRD